MSGRETILRNLRAALPQAHPLPDLQSVGPWQTFDDPVARFCEVLSTVGGNAVRCASREEAHAALLQVGAWNDASKRCSFVAGVGESSFDALAVSDAHEYEDVDFAVFQGELAVAENAAVWVTDRTVPDRTLYFIPQHVALVVPAGSVVNNLHEGYAQITVAEQPFGAWMSGPSKTADIEQSLVIGAHGARSLNVFLIDCDV